MDPNQTVGTTPSRVNDIDPIGSDSGTKATLTGLTGANDATETTQTQRIPLIGTSSQDRSLPINQTSISPDQSDIDPRTSRSSSLESSRGQTIRR
ncbi:hypothetical protein F2Q70_00002930 [Brassica cretica]|uniref:Uncharacterized protein n=1 Tax=Brassica cretica TaxID=69181 RepID=A0A8S9IMC2_BRACR|nr:hypothetical protein F2Q70_00002930 [Brassica cretica]